MRGHLGDRMAALVDGELDHDARDRALAHLTRCPECRLAVAQERWIKERLKSLPAGEPSAAMLGSLFTAAHTTDFATAGSFPIRTPHAWEAPSRLLFAGAWALCVAMFGIAYLLGGGSGTQRAPQAPAVSPPVGQFSTQFVGTTEGSPFSDPAVGVLPTAVERPAQPVASR